jgi:glutamate synthase domain-containing protein 2
MVVMGLWILLIIVALLIGVALYDILQTKHAILRNYPIIGHFRYLLESVGPELRQYIVTSNDEERPFSRDQRRWVYASSKKENNYFGFGTDNDLEGRSNHLILKHSVFPKPDSTHDPLHLIPCAKVWGEARGRRLAFRPDSIVSISAMSYGSLSANAVMAMNRGAAKAKALHNTGEGGIAPYHNEGGDLIYQLGTGYFGARTPEGRFDLEMLKDKVSRFRVRAIEVKLSQGAKPGRGGVLPAAKVSPLIAQIRGVPIGKDVISPAGHSAFSDVDSLLDFVERIADATGLPVGIKSAVGDMGFWHDLARHMESGTRGVDFIQIDGGEGGTGAAPLVFSDHVSMPFKLGFSRVYSVFAERGLDDRIVWIGAGRLGFPIEVAFAMALGCDMIGVAREAMLSIGCIQAQVCHTDKCPTGVATHRPWLMRGLDPTDKGNRLANYLVTLRKELLWLAHAAGHDHPYQFVLEDFELVEPSFRTEAPRQRFGYAPAWRRPSTERVSALLPLMRPEMRPEAR